MSGACGENDEGSLVKATSANNFFADPGNGTSATPVFKATTACGGCCCAENDITVVYTSFLWKPGELRLNHQAVAGFYHSLTTLELLFEHQSLSSNDTLKWASLDRHIPLHVSFFCRDLVISTPLCTSSCSHVAPQWLVSWQYWYAYM